MAVVGGLVGCGDSGGGGGGGGNDNVNTTPVELDPTEFTYLLEESPEGAGLPLWTTPCTRKVGVGDRAPDESRSGLRLSAAKGEFEPVQLIVGPGQGSITVEVDEFSSLGSGARAELARAEYVEGLSERLWPLAPGEEVSLSGDWGVPVWITVMVPRSAPAGEHTTTVRVGHGGETVEIPLTLYVFDFELPEEIHFATQLNVSVASLMRDGGERRRRQRQTLRAPDDPQVGDVAFGVQPQHHLGEQQLHRCV